MVAHHDNYHDSSGLLSLILGLAALVGLNLLPVLIRVFQAFGS